MIAEREKLLKNVAERIEYSVPQLEILISQPDQKEMEATDNEAHQSMIQQF